jgi:hypothetical protein
MSRSRVDDMDFEELSAMLDEAVAEMRNGYGPRTEPASLFPGFVSQEAFSASPGETRPAHALAPAPPPTPFPTAVFPPPLARLVEQGGSALGVPPDLIGVPLLALAGAAIGNAVSIRIKRSWIERPILWTAVAARPGAGKSPALGIARLGIDALELDARDRHRIAVEGWEQEGEHGPRPAQEDLFTTDSTMEAIGVMLTRTRGMAMIRDELAGWIHSMDAYRKGGDRQAWLSLWAGAPPKVTRKTSDPIFVLDPVICLTGGIQPDLLPLLLSESGVRDGLPDRLLLACPETPPRSWTETDLDPHMAHDLIGLFRMLRAIEGSITTPLDSDARAAWIAWYDEIGRAGAAEQGLMEGFLAKAPSQTARLALVLHCLRWPMDPARPVDGETMLHAIVLWGYFRDHFARALALAAEVASRTAPQAAPGPTGSPAPGLRSSGDRLVDQLLSIIAAAGETGVLRGTLTTRCSHLARSAELRETLTRLVDLGHITRSIEQPHAGRPGEVYRLAHPGEGRPA